MKQVERSVFQQEWWLDCVTHGEFGEVTVKNGGITVGWLPYALKRRWGFKVSDMPFLTHTLGPVISPGDGRLNAQMLRRFAITTELLAGLPKTAHFYQVLPSTSDEALAYQTSGFHIRVEFTFISDCTDVGLQWNLMRDKTRNLIRRAREKYGTVIGTAPEEFLAQYDLHCALRKRKNKYADPRTSKLLSLCMAKDQGRIYLAKDVKTGVVAAGIFVVWDHQFMYYLMSTRSPELADSGAVSMLIWEAMNEAHRRGLKFDFDGVTGLGGFRLLSGFAGEVARRFAVEKFSILYHSLDKLRAMTQDTTL